MLMADVVLASSILERLRDLAQNISNGYEFEANFTSEMGELFRRVGEDGLCFIRNSLSSPHYSSIQLMFHQGSVEHLKERQRSKELIPLSRAISLLDLAAALWVDDCDLNFKDAMWNNYSVAYEEMFKEVKTLESSTIVKAKTDTATGIRTCSVKPSFPNGFKNDFSSCSNRNLVQ